MEIGIRILVTFLISQVSTAGGQEEGGCAPGFQVKRYTVEYGGGFRKDQPLTQVVFDDCAGNEGLTFEASDPDFLVDEAGTLAARRDVLSSRPIMFVHGVSRGADDMAQVDVTGLPLGTSHSPRDSLGPDQGDLPFRTKRSLLVPPIIVTENQRAPFPKLIGKSHVFSAEKTQSQFFILSGQGADQDPKGLFTIDKYTGEVYVSRSLDREVIHSYMLEVSLTDMGGDVVEGPVSVVVTVIDQNDNRPIFRERRYAGEVLEGSPTGTIVMTMTALDADDPSTDNAALRYTIVRQLPDKPSPNMFSIDPEKGDILTSISANDLDRETLPTTQYELHIVAKDMAGSEVSLEGTATATITITDKNDHAPEFTHKVFQANVDEGSTGVVVNLTVDDRDDPATGAWRALYSIVSGDPGNSFHIQTNPDNNEGMLSVVKPLDYETSAYHTLYIRVENEDPLVPDAVYGPSSTSTVDVSVLDVNEGPVFSPDPLRVTLMENVALGSSVAALNATDPDIKQTQSIRFAVLRDPAGWLSVNPVRGTVNTSAPLDRESPFVHDNRYTAVFIATDNGTPPATGTGTLVVHLQDYNDNAPYVFPSVARVCEDAKDLSVAIVGGRDRDIHPNAGPFKIELAQQPGLDKTWKVTRVNGTHSEIVLLHSLRRANYNLPLLVTDSGVPPLSNSTEVKVQVCTCKKNRMDCSSAHSHRCSLLTSLFTLLLSLALLCL